MRTVTTIIRSLKCAFRNFSTKVFSRFHSEMKHSESLEGIQSVAPRPSGRPSAPVQEKPSTLGQTPSPKTREKTLEKLPEKGPEKAPVSWMARAAKAAAAAHAAATHAGAAHASAAHIARSAATQAAAAAATQAALQGGEEFPAMKKKIQEFIPRLNPHLHKGDCGKIAVFGGSFEYTGAPFFAAISALKTGADLVHVFCCKEAGPVIKSYSPELIVHPCLDTGDGLKHIEPWLEKFHALVIGPGMGRSPAIFKHVSHIIAFCKRIIRPAPPLILDADALHLITEDLNLIRHYPAPIFMTPNAAEFSKLATRASETNATRLATYYNAVILQKGVVDVISNGFHTNKTSFTDLGLTCGIPGSKRRCGGQGDVLAGCLATFVAWAHNYVKTEVRFDFAKIEMEETGQYKPGFLRDTFMFYTAAAYGASVITRTSSRSAFEANGRGMTASDVVTFVEKSFKTQFEV